MTERMQPFLGEIQASLASVTLGSKAPSPAASAPTDAKQAACALVTEAVTSFLHQDLLQASLRLMEGARGSFGLCLSHSLDADSDFVVAARGQTMSVAFYPSQHLVTFGSEAAACKVSGHFQTCAWLAISLPTSPPLASHVGARMILHPTPRSPLPSRPLSFTPLTGRLRTRRSAWATKRTWAGHSVSTLMMCEARCCSYAGATMQVSRRSRRVAAGSNRPPPEGTRMAASQAAKWPL